MPYWIAVSALGFDAAAVEDVRFVELGDDLASPVKSTTAAGARLFREHPSESKLLALARYLIEHLDENGNRSPIWRERMAQFEQRDTTSTLTPLAAKAQTDRETRSNAAKGPRDRKLPSAEACRAELNEKMSAGNSERDARSRMRAKYGVSASALRMKLKANLAR
ncbi:hypothetical protein [Variovorax sp. LG9.2]|uniref:hypothetical protein n=1 Tax=Variovorax sp. LG9.2 TaxID=3048626 RepID=UPI002B22930F|nr:hypothetical protein [Variovorax sp. LG9.2]MEB0059250.1 hypothetical protein [Variovorax sp. LG9.2]